MTDAVTEAQLAAGSNPGGLSDLEARSNLTRSQFLIWTGQKLAPGTPIYNMGWRFDLPVAVDPGIFERAFAHVAEACDSLRTIITEADGVPRQEVLSRPAGDFAVVALASQAEALRWIEARMRRVFDVRTQTFDSALLMLPGERSIWFLNQHHLVTDAASGSLLFGEVARAYEAFSQGSGARLNELPAFAESVEAERHPTAY